MNKQEKKSAYNERILQKDHGTFTPLMFLVNGSMGSIAFGTNDIWKKKLSAVDFK